MQGRYARQVRVVGAAGQLFLHDSKVLIVGLGGLGCPAATQLALAGVGKLGLCDFDTIETSNLHRQPLYTAAEIGRKKSTTARARLAELAPEIELVEHAVGVDAANASTVIAGYDVVLDCTDSLEARYALSDACARLGKPLIQAGLGALDGELAQLCGTDAACYRCLYPDAVAQETCATEGTLGPLAGTIGNLQALWCMQLILGWPEAKPGRMLLFDGRTGETQSITLTRRADCKAHMQSENDGPACPMPWNAPDVTEIGVDEFAGHMPDFFILDVREQDEHDEYAIPGSHLIPLGQLQRRTTELPKDRPLLVYCAVGGRSAHATHFLRQQGFQAVNLRGGVRAWAMSGRAR